MNKKRFTEFSNYLEAFTQRLVAHFPNVKNYVEEEKRQMLAKYPELVPDTSPSKTNQSSVIEYTLKSSLNKERRRDYFGVEYEIERSTPEDCVASINTVSRAIGSAHKDILFYSSLQGDLLSCLKDMCGQSFPALLRNNINVSRSYAFYLMKFYKLVLEYPNLLQCELPLNFFQKTFLQ